MSKAVKTSGKMIEVAGNNLPVNTANLLIIRDSYAIESMPSTSGVRFVRTGKTAAEFTQEVVNADPHAAFVSASKSDSLVGTYLNMDYIQSVKDYVVKLNVNPNVMDPVIPTDLSESEMTGRMNAVAGYSIDRQVAEQMKTEKAKQSRKLPDLGSLFGRGKDNNGPSFGN